MKKPGWIVSIGIMLITASASATDRLPPLSGGIGESGREMIQQHQADYSLKLVFVGEGGMYLSDVDVVVTDTSGHMISHTTTEGPILLIDLPSGTYTITAASEGISQTTTVTVGKGTKTYHMRFGIKN